MAKLQIRDYQTNDAQPTLSIFLDAVTMSAAADYTPAQIEAWARRETWVLDEWDTQMRRHGSLVALVDGEVAGFTDVNTQGYIHMLFTHPDFSRRGVATALLRFVEEQAQSRGIAELSAGVSITARPLFESAGFRVMQEQEVVLRGERLRNFWMRRDLGLRL